MNEEKKTINIRPPTSVYATYRRLSYQPWYAIAEFVDNSTQNYYNHRDELKEVFKIEKVSSLKIRINYFSETNVLQIKDNANGMDFEELSRAVMLNRLPPDTSGRCEFGMGLKTAACWFGRKWSIETTRLGSTKCFRVDVDVDKLSQQGSEELEVNEAEAEPGEHGTQITIYDLYKPIKGKTPNQVKEHLCSMYRVDLRNKEIEIYWDGVALNFEEPPILEELDDKSQEKTIWKKDVDFDVPWESEGKSLHVNGWIGIRIPASMSKSGFVLIRRGRVIIGGPKMGYRPEEVFGQPNSYRYQRIIGELHLGNWPVSQAKDAFDWSGGLEDKFIEILKEQSKDYCDKAEELRTGRKGASGEEMQEVGRETKLIFESKELITAIGTELSSPTPSVSAEKQKEGLKELEMVSEGPIEINLSLPGGSWNFKMFWQDRLSEEHWISIEYPQENEILIYLNSKHPFFEPYLDNNQTMGLIQKLVVSLALAEKMARNASANGQVDASDFRTYMNKVLRHVGQIKVVNND